MNANGDARLDRVEAILRANQMHEAGCSYAIEWRRIRRSPDPGMPVHAKCDCWLSDPPVPMGDGRA